MGMTIVSALSLFLLALYLNSELELNERRRENCSNLFGLFSLFFHKLS